MIICFLRHMLKQGGTAVNYAEVRELVREQGRTVGAVIEDRETGASRTVRARAVINAAGPFVDGICRMDDPQARPRIAPSQGIHLILDADYLGGTSAVMLPGTSDGRILFAIPWHGRVLYGTTDTPVAEPLRHPVAQEEEIDYLIEHGHRIFRRPVTRDDIIHCFAGLRPLPAAGGGADTANVSRKFVLETSPSGLITMYGGKWTTCRAMGEAAVERAIEVAGLEPHPSRTKETVFEADNEPASHLEEPGVDWIRYAVDTEMARTADDILLRRTRLGLLDPAKAQACREKVERVLSNIQH
jgi:glycerol-3-phosphate dehydrogenase